MIEPVYEYKLYIKYPKWLFIISLVYDICFCLLELFGIVSFLFIINYEDNIYGNVFDIVYYYIFPLICVMALLFSLHELYQTIQINIYNKYYYTINGDGIFVNALNTYKYLKWDSELYYMITDSFMRTFSYKKMLPLEGEMINGKNIKHGYIFLKSGQGLKNKTDNKNSIIMPSRWFEKNIQINDIVGMINRFNFCN
jgi:hypothetical protein